MKQLFKIMDMNSALNDLNQANSRIITLYCDWCKKKGLNYHTFIVLYALYEKDGRTQKELSSRTHLIKQTINNIVKALDSEGYLIIRSSEDNYKEKCISLNEKGRKYADGVLKELLKIEDAVIKEMGEKKIQEMADLSKHFGNLLQKNMQ